MKKSLRNETYILKIHNCLCTTKAAVRMGGRFCTCEVITAIYGQELKLSLLSVINLVNDFVQKFSGISHAVGT